jgi:hypothetical protein
MTLSEAHGRIDHLEKELESVINLIDSGQSRVNSLIANIDETGQSLRDKNSKMGKHGASKMVLDLLPKARDMRGSLNGIKERCQIALKGEVVNV